MKPVTHQFTLFEYNQMRPRTKVPISRERIIAVQRLLNNDPNGAAAVLREIREALENYEQRISNGQATQND